MTMPKTIAEAGEAFRSGALMPSDLVEHAITRADELDGVMGVFLSRSSDAARSAAAESDRRFRMGAPRGPLDGIPIGIKDIVADPSGVTTAQSLVLDSAWSHAIGTATVVERLRSAGAVVMGKTTTMEFAIGMPDVSKPFPIPRNPWALDRWAGGSSSGSASGLILGMFLGAVGTDTAGSIRMPAAYCGVTGLKPTFGSGPKTGVVPLSYSLDHVGPMARTAADCAILLAAMSGFFGNDPYSRRRESGDFAPDLCGHLAGVRIATDSLDRFALAGIDPDQPKVFEDGLRMLEDAGAILVETELPHYLEAVAVDVVVMLSEAHAYHAPDLRTRWNDYGLATRVLLASADALTGADYVQAQRVRRIIHDEIAALFDDVDLIVTPTAHRGAPRLDELDPGNPFSAMPSGHAPYWDPLGHPTVAAPIGLSSDGTPLSMSITAPHWHEALALRAADAYQKRSDFLRVTPPAGADPVASQQPIAEVQDETGPDTAAGPRPPATGADWTCSEQELKLLNGNRSMIRGLADLLGAVADARYADPLGGFTFPR